MRILCVTDFPMRPPNYRWIWHHVSGERDEVDFLSRQAPDWFGGLGKVPTRWASFFRLGLLAMNRSLRHEYDLIVAWENKAGLPLALLRRLSRRTHPPLLLLGFTLPPYPSFLLPLIIFSLGAVDHLTVLASSEIEAYQRLLGLPPSKINLGVYGIHDTLDHTLHSIAPTVDSGPYIHASGRSWRDYRTLIDAVTGLNTKVIIHGRDYNFKGLEIPDNVEIGDLVPSQEYRHLLLNCLFEVVPLHRTLHPIGASQILHSMMMGKPVVATRTACTPEFVQDGVTGLLVEPGDAPAMRAAIVHFLENPQLVAQMGLAARERYEERHTFEVFAQQTYDLLHRLYDC